MTPLEIMWLVVGLVFGCVVGLVIGICTHAPNEFYEGQ